MVHDSDRGMEAQMEKLYSLPCIGRLIKGFVDKSISHL